jgi:hypothetical protein
VNVAIGLPVFQGAMGGLLLKTRGLSMEKGGEKASF